MRSARFIEQILAKLAVEPIFQGWKEALTRDPHLANGLNVHAGHVNHEAVTRDLGYEYLSAEDALKVA